MSDRPDCITASGLGRVIACPRSFQLEKLCPESESEFATEGTRKHELMAEWNRKFFANVSADFAADEDVRFCQAEMMNIAVSRDCWGGNVKHLVEERLYLGDSLSGQIDYARVGRTARLWLLIINSALGRLRARLRIRS